MKVLFCLSLLFINIYAFSVDMDSLREAIIEVESGGNPYAFCASEKNEIKITMLKTYLEDEGISYKLGRSPSGQTIFSITPKDNITASKLAIFFHENGYKNYDVGLMQINVINLEAHPIFYLDEDRNIEKGMEIVQKCYGYYIDKHRLEASTYGVDQYLARNLIRAIECYKYGNRNSFNSFENAIKVINIYNKKLEEKQR